MAWRSHDGGIVGWHPSSVMQCPHPPGESPCAQGRLWGVRFFPCHCEERSDAAIRSLFAKQTNHRRWFCSGVPQGYGLPRLLRRLAMTGTHQRPPCAKGAPRSGGGSCAGIRCQHTIPPSWLRHATSAPPLSPSVTFPPPGESPFAQGRLWGLYRQAILPIERT